MSDELKPLCSACGGEGIIRTGITEAPTTNCRDCKGSGFAPAAPVAQDPDAGEREFNAARLRRLVNLLGLGNAVPEGDLLGVMGSVLGMVAREIEELKAAAAQEPVAWMWKMHGWAITAHSKNRAVQTFVDVSRPPTSTIESPDFISLTPLYAAPVPAIPPSYRLVPIEPTPEMLEPLARAWCNEHGIDPDAPQPPHGEHPNWYGHCSPYAEMWHTLLTAAPQSPAPQDVKPKRKLDQDAAWRIAQHANYLALPSEFPSVQIMMTPHDLVRFFEIACKDYTPQDATDAQRYRFLRNPLNDIERISSICAGEAMDEAVDAAIAAQDARKDGV